jgi:hypothetical protein
MVGSKKRTKNGWPVEDSSPRSLAILHVTTAAQLKNDVRIVTSLQSVLSEPWANGFDKAGELKFVEASGSGRSEGERMQASSQRGYSVLEATTESVLFAAESCNKR